jgi:hypothetical protein
MKIGSSILENSLALSNRNEGVHISWAQEIPCFNIFPGAVTLKNVILEPFNTLKS